MRHPLLLLSLLMSLALPAAAQFNVSLDIHLDSYPELQRVPGYPVYYAPALRANFFFYDGLYWLYERDDWYSSPWYNGPWRQMRPEAVPVYVLRVPVRYYRSPPSYFQGWVAAAPPRWGEHWGPGWQSQHRGWDRWDRHRAPAPAPLPSYQRQFPSARYPQPEQQQALHQQQYRYRPREAAVRELLPPVPQPDVPSVRRTQPPRKEAMHAPEPRDPPGVAPAQRQGPREAERGKERGKERDQEHDRSREHEARK